MNFALKNFKLLTKSKGNLINNFDFLFKKFIIYVWGCHCDYSPQAPKILPAPLLRTVFPSSHPSIHPRMALQHLLHHGLPLSPSCLLQPYIPRICNASLWMTSSHLVLNLPTDLVLWNFPLGTFLGILSSIMI